VVCVAPVEWLRWVMVSLSCALSTFFLSKNLKTLWNHLTPADMSRKGTIILALTVLAHIGLGIGTKLYFFQYKY
jgi:hypothetical protein